MVVVLGAAVVPRTGQSATVDRTVYDASCRSCHAQNGSGTESLRAPAIAGLDAAYVRRQLDHFRTGRRAFGEDRPFAQGMVTRIRELSDEQIDQVTAFVASLPPVTLDQPLDPAGVRARSLYGLCSTCHGGRGQGNPNLGAPRIAGQYRWYLKEQLTRFRSGDRGTHPDDRRGRQMRAMAATIADDADVERLANYIARMGR